MGISYEGKDVEIRYRDLTGASESPRAGLGDAVLDGHFVEIKAASKSTLNQVRAVKYIPLVVFHGPTRQWYVVPPHVVVKLCCAKARGQHSENPFESSTLSLGNLGSHRVSETDLEEGDDQSRPPERPVSRVAPSDGKRPDEVQSACGRVSG